MTRRWATRACLLVGALVALVVGWGRRANGTDVVHHPAGGPAENAYKQLWDLEPTEVMLSAGGVLTVIGSVVASIVAVRILGLRLWAQRRARSVL
jgi:hypothetical protein